MKLGKQIRELRMEKNVTQEEMAAELGVTAAAVSKWENDYTLPDILMLGALADYFSVTTDALLGRDVLRHHAVILTENQALGERIKALASRYGFRCHGIFTDAQKALAAGSENEGVEYLIVGTYQGGCWDESPLQKIVSTHTTDEEILDGLEWVFQNCMDDGSWVFAVN